MAEPGLVDNKGPGCGVRGAGCRGAGARGRRGLWKTRGPGHRGLLGFAAKNK